ncbi:hypothetical protein [Sphingobium sp. DC-2]|uniref:hypothetical protein n=1 Tax=Sphingobium sp. DC-2 TaxID=1303256 RepID=UPI0004C2D125|nr:hypothetical protein [Sphingobium sp. DC-2]
MRLFSSHNNLLAAALLGGGVLLPQPGRAADGPDADKAATGQPLSEAELDINRGGQTIVSGSQTLTSVLSGNSLKGDYSAGAISLSGEALSNFNGIGNFAINTGAQVSLQTAVNLTINVHP